MAVLRCLCLLFLQLLLISLMVAKSTSKPNYMQSFCPVKTAFAPNSKYEANLNTLFHSLSSNATVSNFFSSSANNVVYGLFLCRGDLTTTACSDCVSTAISDDLPKKYCRNRKVAVIWYDECMVRYSKHPVSGKMETSPRFSFMNQFNTTGSLTGFSEVLQKAISDVVAQASKDGSGKKFATSEVKITAKASQKTLYAMGQCTPDLNKTACSDCLTEAAMNLPLSDGGRTLQPSCNVRYEIYPFFALSTAAVPAPAPTPTEAPAPTMIPSAPPPPPELAPERAPAPRTSPITSATPINSPATNPGPNASNKRTHSTYLNIFGGLVIFVILNLYHNIF